MSQRDTRYQQILARDARQNGRFLTGVLTTGIYCLPSCTARKPKLENVRFFDDEAGAQAAGLRACKRCRPDLFYRGVDIDAACYEDLRARLYAAPADIDDLAGMAALAGVARTKLTGLCREHGHTTPASLLRQAKLAFAARLLLDEQGTVAEAGFSAGFASEAVFHRQFLATYRLTPAVYRALCNSPRFTVPLPAGYRPREVLAYLGRDPDGPAERLRGLSLTKALLIDGHPVRLAFTFDTQQAQVAVLGDAMPDMPAVHAIALRCLGFAHPADIDNPALKTLAARRPGLSFPLTASVFEALAWAIVGQQVNLAFATQLRRVMIEHTAIEAGDGMLAHPDAAAVAALDPAMLHARQFSRSKAGYLVDTARAVLQANWQIETLPSQSAVQALRRLQALRGIGPWTAQYTLLRGCGFADCVPVGDAGLTAALQRHHALAARPDAKETMALMARYSPQRSLATAHLWASLKPDEEAPQP